ncbi:hypothetical protein EIP91_008204 [Steccherinum ochraceum]|uniref:Zn(2)-C6 fungal-type domain-containing protein n=1 Tax=Steccherinum ochraceum TaxID=92696 RepID=A0A4R0RU87_9APHY|nr:hypothetical protein EIP91_008204 [Steccherinum ochraceum]
MSPLETVHILSSGQFPNSTVPPRVSMSQAAKEALSRSDTSLPRGAACLPCRKRKMRCDGGRPVCAQCVSRNQSEDCEYATPQGATRTQLLEENIHILEARIQELENPDSPSSSVKLHEPHVLPVNVGPLAQSSHVNERSTTEGQTTLSADEIYLLTDTFSLHASRLGFFMNVPRFISRVRSPQREPGQSALHDVLVSVSCLWGCRLSDGAAMQERQDQLLGLVLEQVASSLSIINSGPLSHDFISFIQAEVLLANYFFTNDRLLEGRYHSSAAVSLTLSLQLNLQKSIRIQDAGLSEPSATLLSGLPSPDDLIQIGERVNAFWTVHSLYKAWAAVLDLPSTVWAGEGPPGTQVEIPWPLSMDACEKGQISISDLDTRCTIMSFLRSGETTPVIELPPLALHSRASLLYTHAAWVSNKFTEDMPAADRTACQEQLHVLHTAVNQFLEEIVALEPIRPIRFLLTTSILTRGALIRLHAKSLKTETRSLETSISAANGILNILQQVNTMEFKYVDPITAVVLSCVGQVYVDEIVRCKLEYERAERSRSGRQLAYVSSLQSSAQQLLICMTDFGRICPLMASRAKQFRTAFATVQ